MLVFVNLALSPGEAILRRRDFITLMGGAAAWPMTCRAQQAAVPVIGVLGSSTPEAFSSFMVAFRKGLNEAGYVEGRNVAIEYHWSGDQLGRLPAMATELVRRQVSLIAALGNQQPALAAKGATTAIPIVFAMGADPVENGLVASLNRPGGNITGMSQLSGIVVSKRIQILHDLVPNAKVYGVLRNPDNNREPIVRDTQDAVRAVGGTMELVNARAGGELDAAFAALAQRRVDALSVLPDSLFIARGEQLAAVSARD